MALSDQQRANLRAKLPQVSAQIRAAEQNLAAARKAGRTHEITTLARTVNKHRGEKEDIVRKLGGHPSRADERRATGKQFGAKRR